MVIDLSFLNMQFEDFMADPKILWLNINFKGVVNLLANAEGDKDLLCFILIFFILRTNFVTGGVKMVFFCVT